MIVSSCLISNQNNTLCDKQDFYFGGSADYITVGGVGAPTVTSAHLQKFVLR